MTIVTYKLMSCPGIPSPPGATRNFCAAALEINMTIVIFTFMTIVMKRQFRPAVPFVQMERDIMARKALIPSLVATALIASAAAYADPAPESPAQAWIARIEAPELQPARPGTATVRHDSARDFLARFEVARFDRPSFPPTQPAGKVAADSHPDREFIARLSTSGSAAAERHAVPQSPSYAVGLAADR